ncbi:hypothetical protein FB645_004517 [Coemansia sp. IMI 203386]|nr:hypothetical protein FB645_004517 [Coemansia sp. IMI 203386]
MATLTRAPSNSTATITASAADARPACKGSLALAAARTCSGRSSSADTAASRGSSLENNNDDDDSDYDSAWWLSSDTEHAHTACPLRPFAHMVVGLCASDDDDVCATPESISAQALAAAHVVHLSDALRRKMHSVAPDTRNDGCVGDMLAFAAAERGRSRAASLGLWGVLGWLVGAAAAAHDDVPADASSLSSTSLRRRPHRRQPVARRAEDDPLLVGNEGLGAVEVASVRTVDGAATAQGGCVFALCAHAMSAETQARWLAWHALRYPGRARATDTALRLAVVHVAEVSTLHRVARLGIDALVPPPLPMLEQSFAQLADSGRVVGPPPAMPPLAPPVPRPVTPALAPGVRWLALLVSRHGLVEMAHPLARTPLVVDDDDNRAGACVALGAWLGESLFGRIHPEDVVRVVRALRLAWDARPDAYHFARLRRLWQQKRRTGKCDGAAAAPALRQVLRHDGIEAANGVVELNVQLRLSGSPDLDWTDADAAAAHTRFARMKLTRWPLVLKPARSSAEPHDGFVLVGMQPLPEPSGARRSHTAPPMSLAHADPKKRSISSVASAATLVGLGTADPVRLGRSASSLSCVGSTARPSVAVAIPPPHLAARRRSNIAVGSLGADADGLAYGTPRELGGLS